MLEFDNLKLELEKYRPKLEELADSLNLDRLQLRVEELERKQLEPGFWDDPEKSSKIVQEAGSTKRRLDEFNEMKTAFEDAEALIEMGQEEEDESLVAEVQEQIGLFKDLYEKLRLTTLLTGEFDSKNVVTPQIRCRL